MNSLTELLTQQAKQIMSTHVHVFYNGRVISIFDCVARPCVLFCYLLRQKHMCAGRLRYPL
jgi:hypothetical protein